MVSLSHGFYRTYRVWACIAFLSVSLGVYSQQAPGGVQGSSLWYSESDLSKTVGNYYTFNLLNFENRIDVEQLHLTGASTLFFVLKPSFNTERGAQFLRLGDVAISDEGVAHGVSFSEIDFKEDVPVIMSLEIQRSRRFAHRGFSEIQVGDTSLFSLAEFIVFPGRLNRDEMRKVHTYLALKYSVTITDNSETEYQDYFRPDEYTYWNTRVDRLYRNRVIGLGRSDDQSFYQSQTVTTQGASVMVALDHFDSIGQMPTVEIADESFIIFSEKKSKGANSIHCPIPSAESHILHNWKFQLQNWQSQAEYLLLKVPSSEVDKRDSLFLSDGYWNLYLPIDSYEGSDFLYKIPLAELTDYRHYFFTNSQNSDCLEIFTYPESGDLNVVTELIGDREWVLETQSMSDGTLISEHISGTHARRFLREGQYVVSVLDADGEMISSEIVRIQSTSNRSSIGLEELDIRVYPDPVQTGQSSTLEVRNMPSSESLRMTVSDMNGKIHQSIPVDYSEEIIQSIAPLSVPGTYTVTLHQGSSVYSVKLVVRSK
ncbi:MAG: T9SS type A sorting domain-containing protein [Bacteroidetes bacterium]|nr:MAG: T9SS type A sorting domain-containing protein [Bacteroidota bacterium]